MNKEGIKVSVRPILVLTSFIIQAFASNKAMHLNLKCHLCSASHMSEKHKFSNLLVLLSRQAKQVHENITKMKRNSFELKN